MTATWNPPELSHEGVARYLRQCILSQEAYWAIRNSIEESPGEVLEWLREMREQQQFPYCQFAAILEGLILANDRS